MMQPKCHNYKPDHNGECLNCDEPLSEHMKTLFTINIKVTRPYATADDDMIRKDYLELWGPSLRRIMMDELASLGITGLNVEVKVK